MTALLLRLFVKDYQNPENPAVHTAIGKMAGITGVLCNVFLFLGKLLAGLLSGSISIVADAVNNLSDAGSSVVTLAGFQLARRPADREHPYPYIQHNSKVVFNEECLPLGAAALAGCAEGWLKNHAK